MAYQSVIARVYGIVQGVGFRPTVSRHADRAGVTGSVCNKGPYVEIKVQGQAERVDAFLHAVEFEPPERSSILKMDVKPYPEMETCPTFEIIESEKIKGDIFVSPDIAICEKCKKEMYDPEDKRYLHPFINCTCCGPRLTILDSMPYDRVRTSMGEFPMCPTCAYEYTHSETRRYDAQPVCCNDCGPEVYILPGKGEEKEPVPMLGKAGVINHTASMEKKSRIKGREAIIATRQMIKDGGIVAIKGIGGFHLCCDATNEEAVMRLRLLKTRPAKPFAVMMRNMDTVEAECFVTQEQMEVLNGHQKPIILLERREEGRIAPSVAPDNPKVGVMLPYAPVQLLLFDYDDGIQMPDTLVMTSGNRSGAPICRDDVDAVTELSGMCDLILSHNRLIRLRADDSVMDYFEGKPYMIRRSRGYAPLPFMTSNGWSGEVLAVGGELKNTFCIGKNDLFYQSPYIGDMADLRTVNALKESIKRMEGLLEAEPKLIACDLHPKYNTTYVAEELGLPVIQVQHHYAHIAACMAENDYNKKVIGISMDGTGYGLDHTIWGGEIMLADYDGFQRRGHIRPFKQIGGDASAKEGWRIAVSMIYDLCDKDRAKALDLILKLDLCDEKTAGVQFAMSDNNINSITSTSCGRLFDAVSAILQIRRASSFEGEASTTLEFRAEAYEAACKASGKVPLWELESSEGFDEALRSAYEKLKWQPMLQEEEDMLVLPTEELVSRILEAGMAGVDSRLLAYYFHEVLARMVEAVAVKVREKAGIDVVALSGGVYQNQLLLKLSCKKLREQGFRVLTHSLLPPNDGGIALGQAAVAMNRLNKE